MLTPLDAEFLDGMIGVNETIVEGCSEYLRLTDAASDATTMDLARGLLMQAQQLDTELRTRRGQVSSTDVNTAAAQSAVEVTGSY